MNITANCEKCGEEFKFDELEKWLCVDCQIIEEPYVPTTKVIPYKTYMKEYINNVGSLMFVDDWYECNSYVDKVKLRKNIKSLLPKGARIYSILIPTEGSPNYKNVVNKTIPYKTPLCASPDQDGAYLKHYPEINFTMWASDYPIGDAIVVYK